VSAGGGCCSFSIRFSAVPAHHISQRVGGIVIAYSVSIFKARDY